jgi:Ca2+-binding RTX toxin-like protein
MEETMANYSGNWWGDTWNGTASADSAFGHGGDDTLYGHGGNDYLNGNADYDKLYGGDGDDTLIGQSGNDSLYGEANNDWLYGDDGWDWLSGGDGNDELWGGNTDDRLIGGGGDDYLNGGANGWAWHDTEFSVNGFPLESPEGDILWGNAGNDYLDGGPGADQMKGDSENDTYVVDNTGDVVFELIDINGGDPGGHDTVISWVGWSLSSAYQQHVEDLILASGSAAQWANGNELNNRLVGNDTHNTIFGYGGDDRIEAGGGFDYLAGGSGRDVIYGGADGDVFNFHTPEECGFSAATADQLLDFNAAEGDVIDLSVIDANTIAAGDQGFAFIGGNQFSGVAGQLRFASFAGSNGFIVGDVNGDRVSDFFIEVNAAGMQASALIL